GVAPTGALARPPATLSLPAIAGANYTLAFDRYAYVALPNAGDSLAMDGAFTLEAWIYPTDDSLAEMQIIGDDAADASARSPFLSLVAGSRIAVGFGTGAREVRCVSAGPVIALDKWQKVTARFSLGTGPDGANAFQLQIN